MKKLLLSTAVGLLVGLSASCDDEEGNDDGAAHLEACQRIVDACHEKDGGTDEMINDYCHQAAHDGVDGHGDAAVCSERADECVEACNAAPPIEAHETEAHETGGHESGG